MSVSPITGCRNLTYMSILVLVKSVGHAGTGLGVRQDHIRLTDFSEDLLPAVASARYDLGIMFAVLKPDLWHGYPVRDTRSPSTASVTTKSGLTFDVVSAGTAGGPGVILLHGFPETSATWKNVLPGLAAGGLRLYAPDQRGYSPLARPAGVASYRIGELADDVVELAEALDLQTFHLVGHDWGASVAWHVAAHHADRVRSLTAASVPHLAAYGEAIREDAAQQKMSSYFGLFRQADAAETLLVDDARYLRDMYGERVPTDLAELYLRRLREPGALRSALHWYGAMNREMGTLGPVSVPTTFIWGAADPWIGRGAAKRCAHHVTADFRYVELEEVSHWIPEERPDVVVAEVLRRAHS